MKLSYCTITDNTAEWNGGGLHLDGSSATVNDNAITDNTAGSDGGGLHLDESNATVSDNTIMDNAAEWGGGLALRRSDATLINNIIADNQASIGGSGLHTRVGERALEIGYWIRAGYEKQGLATEATAALTRVAFEVNEVQRVEIHCDPRNAASAAVARKVGMVHEATLRERTLDSEGLRHDAMIWTLLASEYPSSPAKAIAVEAFDATGRQIL